MPNGSAGTEITPVNYSANISGDAEPLQFVPGLLVEHSDLNELVDWVRAMIGNTLTQMTGMLDMLMWYGFNVTGNGTGMQLTFGGTYTQLFLQGRLLTYCPPNTFTVAPGGTTSRIDALCAKYVRVTDPSAPSTSRMIKQSGVVQTGQTAQREFDSYDLVYVPNFAGNGNGGPGTGTIPAGYVLAGFITVPAGATNTDQLTVRYNFDSFVTSIQNMIQLSRNAVTSLDQKTGPLWLFGHDGLQVDDTVAPGEIHLRYPQPIVGQTFCKFGRITQSGGTTTVTLDAPLPGGSNDLYRVKARASVETTAGGTLAASGATWDVASQTDFDLSGVDPASVIGTAVGGQQPSVSFTPSGSITNPPNGTADNVLELWCVCYQIDSFRFLQSGGTGSGSTVATLPAALWVAGAISSGGGTTLGGGGGIGGSGGGFHPPRN